MATMFYSAMLLTGANLLLRLISLGFQVYLSGQIGASGIGLLQLTLSVSTLALTAGMAGIRTSAMYLTAGEIGSGRKDRLRKVISMCFSYSLFFSTLVALGVWFFAPRLAEGWIRDGRTIPALRIFAAFLPVVCLVGVMTGYFTAAGRVKELVAVEIGEQLFSMTATVLLLSFWGTDDAGRACTCVVAGSSLASVMTLFCLLWRLKVPEGRGSSKGLLTRLLRTSLPLALADDMRMGISTVENLMVPRRLGLYASGGDPLAAYGQVVGMVFPALMFPAAILFSLSELLIPELSRCAAGGRKKRIQYLTERSLRVALLYGLAAGGILFTAARPLGVLLYKDEEVGRLLQRFALLAPMLYLDAVTDASIKGMGQQVACVRYNTFTNVLDVIFLFFLLPKYGLVGYFWSFVITHAINFALSIHRLYTVTGVRPRLGQTLRAVLGAVLAGAACVFIPKTSSLASVLALGTASLSAFAFFGFLLKIWGKEDINWLLGLVHPIDKPKSRMYNIHKY